MNEMHNEFAVTFYLKEVFTKYDDFKSYLLDYCDLVAYSFPASNILYNVVMLRYANSNINYDTIEAFKRHFAVDIANVLGKFDAKYKLIQDTYKLTEEDLVTVNEGIVNTAARPNDEIKDPLHTVVPFISEQTSSITNSGKLYSYLDAIAKLTDNGFTAFLDVLDKHFMQIYCDYKEVWLEND